MIIYDRYRFCFFSVNKQLLKLNISLKSAVRMREMPFQRPKFQKFSPDPPYRCEPTSKLTFPPPTGKVIECPSQCFSKNWKVPLKLLGQIFPNDLLSKFFQTFATCRPQPSTPTSLQACNVLPSMTNNKNKTNLLTATLVICLIFASPKTTLINSLEAWETLETGFQKEMWRSNWSCFDTQR